ncbi:MAG: hypothetical protein RIR87_981 [Actinomycetota bacterium]
MTLTRWTSMSLVTAGVAAAMGVLLRGDIGLWLDVFALLLLGALPALRVVVLAVSWSRTRDFAFAAAAVVLLLLMLLGTILVIVLK